MYIHIFLFIISVLEIVCATPIKTASADNETNAVQIHDLCKTVVIAHRGASGYVPEHTLGAYALAIIMGADFIEPDLVMTKDGHLVARHDNELSMTTDIAQHPEFAERRRNQTIGRLLISGWFTEDFTVAELKTLRVIERLPDLRPGNARMDGTFTIPTFEEIVNLVKTLQLSQKRVIGIYPEIKHSTHFQRLGLPMETPLLTILRKNGYWRSTDPVYIQSFEVTNLKELKLITELRLMQLFDSKSLQPFDQALLGTGLTYGAMATAEGLREVAKYAAAVGPDKSYIISRDKDGRMGAVTTFVEEAHAVNLKVHPYGFRAENFFLPPEFQSVEDSPAALGDLNGEIRAHLSAGIDGLFADQPDIAVRVRGPCSL